MIELHYIGNLCFTGLLGRLFGKGLRPCSSDILTCPEQKPLYLLEHKELCSRILALDGSIRFVGLVDHLGSLLVTMYRQGLTPLASTDETAKYASQAIFMTGTLAGGLNSKVGRLQYVVGKFDNLVRATIPIVSGSYDKFYLILSFEVDSDYLPIIEGKVLGFLQENRASL